MMATDWYRRDNCRLCHSTDLHAFLSLGELPLAGGFLLPGEVTSEQRYPLTVCFCRDCREVQLLETVSAQVLFRDYRYLASTTSTLSSHFRDYAREVETRFVKPGGLVVEIGCNDGVLLKPLADGGVRAVGVEPADNIAAVARARGCVVYSDFFNRTTAARILSDHGRADVVCANNVFAHIDDLHEVMAGIDLLLSPHGVFVFEVQSLLDLLDGCQYDMIYHEHLMYHSLHALKKFFAGFAMNVFDVARVPIHCGSMRVCVQRDGAGLHPMEKRALDFMDLEEKRGLGLEKTFDAFAATVQEKRVALQHLVESLIGRGKTVAGYGASGRASVHVNLSDLTPEKLPFVVDSSPERTGRLMPGTHNPIVDVDFFRTHPPDYTLVFAYNYLPEIKRKETAYSQAGGRWIVPLPDARILAEQ